MEENLRIIKEIVYKRWSRLQTSKNVIFEESLRSAQKGLHGSTKEQICMRPKGLFKKQLLEKRHRKNLKKMRENSRRL